MLCANLAHGRERRTMDRARPEFLEGAQVLRGGVALVLIESVLRIAAMQAAHQPVAANLRENRRGADLGDQIVAVDDRLGAIQARVLLKRRNLPAVDAQELRDELEPQHRALHRKQRCLQNVDAVDLLMSSRNRRRTPSRCGGSPPPTAHAAARVNSFESRSPSIGRLRIENDGCGHDGPGERTAPCLIDAANVCVLRNEGKRL